MIKALIGNGGFAKGCNQGVGVTGHIIPMDVYAVNLLDFLNTYHKEDIDNISLIKERIKYIIQVLKEKNFDIICLQEVSQFIINKLIFKF